MNALVIGGPPLLLAQPDHHRAARLEARRPRPRRRGLRRRRSGDHRYPARRRQDHRDRGRPHRAAAGGGRVRDTGQPAPAHPPQDHRDHGHHPADAGRAARASSTCCPLPGLRPGRGLRGTQRPLRHRLPELRARAPPRATSGRGGHRHVLLSRLLAPGLPNHRLGTVARALGAPDEACHRALPDARATAHVFLTCGPPAGTRHHRPERGPQRHRPSHKRDSTRSP